MQVDLDFFKAVNDTLGHAAGDHVLQQVARVLVEETRADDTVARTGGDEFVLIFDGLRERQKLSDIAARIIARLSEPIPFQGELCRISASIGIAIWGGGAPADHKQLLTDADLALYASKHQGRARHMFYTDGLMLPGAAPPLGPDENRVVLRGGE
jgi:diguanylate cyclase (GGDEF)-like protein